MAGLAGLVLFGFGGSGCQGAASEIRIGFLVDRPTPIAEATLHAARLAVSTINDSGGIDVNGHPRSVGLVIEDTGNTPEGTTRASLKLINQERVVAMVGSSFSRNAIPSGGVAEKAGVAMISPGSTHPKTTEGRR